MAFFDKARKAAQSAAKKSGELMEVTKINMNISSEEEKIKKLYVKIGKAVYEKFSSGDDVESELVEDCKVISEHEDNIKDYRQKILDIKNIKKCEECGAELEKDVMFCPKCGAKQEQQQVSEKPQRTCPSCGASVDDEIAFCPSCGANINAEENTEE